MVKLSTCCAFSALTLLVGRQEGPVKNSEWWGAGVVICLELGADLHMAQLMLLPLTVSCFSEIQIDFTFLVSAHPGRPGKRAVKQVCVCVCVSTCKVNRCSSLQLHCHTAVGTHMPCGFTRCYLPPGSGDSAAS